MATLSYNAKENYYSFLSGAPGAWELIFGSSQVVNKGDTVEVIEVDSMGAPTGNTMTGTVVFIRCNDFWLYSDKGKLVYIVPD